MKKRALNQDPENGHGGRRRGAGRPPTGNERLIAHVPRELLAEIQGEADRLGVKIGVVVTEGMTKALPAIKRRKPPASDRA